MIEPHEFTAAIPPTTQDSIMWDVRESRCGAEIVQVRARTAAGAAETLAFGQPDGAGCWLVRPAGSTDPGAWLEVVLSEQPRRYYAADVHQAPMHSVPDWGVLVEESGWQPLPAVPEGVES